MNALPIANLSTPVGSTLRHISGTTLVLLAVNPEGSFRVLVDKIGGEKNVWPCECWVLKEYEPKAATPRRSLLDLAIAVTTPPQPVPPRVYADPVAKRTRYEANRARRAEENRQVAKIGGSGTKTTSGGKKKGKEKK